MGLLTCGTFWPFGGFGLGGLFRALDLGAFWAFCGLWSWGPFWGFGVGGLLDLLAALKMRAVGPFGGFAFGGLLGLLVA